MMPFSDISKGILQCSNKTGRPRGFGFIEMDDEAIGPVIQALDGKEMGGRALRVNEAQDKPRGGGGGGGGGGYRR
jgi:RNA recognition motif-containing protein